MDKGISSSPSQVSSLIIVNFKLKIVEDIMFHKGVSYLHKFAKYSELLSSFRSIFNPVEACLELNLELSNLLRNILCNPSHRYT